MMFQPPEMKKLIQITDQSKKQNIKLYINKCTKNLLVLDKSTLYPIFVIHAPTERVIDVPECPHSELLGSYQKLV
jgi:hypothetical protein